MRIDGAVPRNKKHDRQIPDPGLLNRAWKFAHYQSPTGDQFSSSESMTVPAFDPR
jgi:hypothetical protein